MALRFPSLAFFEALQREMRAERERFARLGFFDTIFGIRVLPESPGAAAEFVLGFEVFDCVRVAEGLAGVETDFVAEGSFSAWREMLDNIHALGAADAAHSFNTLTHFGERLSVRYDDPDRHDKVYRFAESIQEFLRLPRRLAPPGSPSTQEDCHVSYLSTTDFAEDQEFVDRFRQTMRGDLELSWMDVAREPVSCRPQNERRGLTFRDLDVGSYGFTEMPERIRQNRSFAPRGAALPPGLPDLQAEVNRKSEVWAYNVEGYYEEAMTRQWNATTDIPWDELQQTELPEEIGKAYAQLLTFLTEVEMIATDVPAKWMGRLNADFFEVKNFIATQAMDEARHTEIFRKRALSTGYGLMRASAHNEFNLKFLRDADSFAEASLALHLQAEGMVLTLFRFSEYISPTEGDKKLFRLVMQDEARHVGYGMQHLKWVLDHFPERRELIHHHLDEAENFVFGGGYATEVVEPFIILSGKGLKKEQIAEGVRITNAFQLKQIEEYFERLAKCGLPERRERSRLWRLVDLNRQAMAAIAPSTSVPHA